MALGNSNHGCIDPRLEATIGIRLASTAAREAGASFNAESILSLSVLRIAILDSNGDVVEASAAVRRDLGFPLAFRETDAVSLPAALDNPAGLGIAVRNELLTEWRSLAAAVRHGSRALMAYQILDGFRHRLLFIPLATWGQMPTTPTGRKPVFSDDQNDVQADGQRGRQADETAGNQVDGRGAVAVLACRTLCGDGELLDSELEHVACDYATLGELECLTVRELDAVRMLGLGVRVSQLSRPLHCSPRRVGLLLRRLRAKLSATDNFKLAVLAVRCGLIDIDDQTWQRTVFLRRG